MSRRLWRPRLRIAAASPMPLDFQAAQDEYLGWLQHEANKSPNTVRAYTGEIRRFGGFLAARGHSLQMEELSREDLRAYQRHLAANLKAAASRARALVYFLISTGCRISEALALDRTDLPRQGNRLVVTGKGAKQRAVYLT